MGLLLPNLDCLLDLIPKSSEKEKAIFAGRLVTVKKKKFREIRGLFTSNKIR